MSLSDTTKINASIKKLSSLAQTSNNRGLPNENLPSGLTVSADSVFAMPLPSPPTATNLYDITDGTVEYLRFPVSFIVGSDTVNGRHGFELKLPAAYEANSSNPKAGTAPFVNSQVINSTIGSLQLIPRAYNDAYEIKPYYDGDASIGTGTQIPLLDPRDWYMDYFNGVFFQQDPPGTGDDPSNPDYIEGFLFIGTAVQEAIDNIILQVQIFS